MNIIIMSKTTNNKLRQEVHLPLQIKYIRVDRHPVTLAK